MLCTRLFGKNNKPSKHPATCLDIYLALVLACRFAISEKLEMRPSQVLADMMSSRPSENNFYVKN